MPTMASLATSCVMLSPLMLGNPASAGLSSSKFLREAAYGVRGQVSTPRGEYAEDGAKMTPSPGTDGTDSVGGREKTDLALVQ